MRPPFLSHDRVILKQTRVIKMKNMLLIINPQSGKAQIKGKLLEVADLFVKAGYQIELYITQREMDAARIVAERGNGQDVIVCSGGDGTLNEVINGMMKLERVVPLGYIPSGSTNDFAASQGIPKTIRRAAELIAAGKISSIDLGCFNDRYFTYVAAFGLMTDVPYATPRESKALLGYQAYILEGIKRLGKMDSKHVRVTVDDQVFEGNILIGMVSNASRIAGIKGLNGRNARFDDGKFEVLLIEYSNDPIKLTEAVTGLLAPDVQTKGVYRFEGSRIRFVFDEPVDWVLDGEFGGSQSEVTIDVKQQALQIFK